MEIRGLHHKDDGISVPSFGLLCTHRIVRTEDACGRSLPWSQKAKPDGVVVVAAAAAVTAAAEAGAAAEPTAAAAVGSLHQCY